MNKAIITGNDTLIRGLAGDIKENFPVLSKQVETYEYEFSYQAITNVLDRLV